MTQVRRLKLVLSPPAKVGEHDTGLRFTDILFGFVIRELFIRLQDWPELATASKWQLVAATVLVLGSWIGFRRSLTRSVYEVKFFNLPFSRFVLDQGMVILYFRVATLTPGDPSRAVDPSVLAHETIETVLLVFFLYIVWDLLGILMRVGSKYPKIINGEPDKTQPNPPEWWGFLITVFFGALTVGLYLIVDHPGTYGCAPEALLAALVVLLLMYRWAKEVRTSWAEEKQQVAAATSESAI